MRRALLTTAALACVACADGAPPEPAPGCNPLVGADCLLPFPSAFFEQPDATTPTGRRLAVAASAAPLQNSGTRLDVTRLNRADGFSPATAIWVHLPQLPAASQLPSETDLTQSLQPRATVQLWDTERGERVPLWAELDGNTEDDAHRALLIHPAVRLRNATRYAVVLVGLGDAPAPFAALRDDRPLSRALTAIAPAIRDVINFAVAHGATRDELTLAWDFHTASELSATRHLLAMRDALVPTLADATVTVDKVTDAAANHPRLLRTVELSIVAPTFLADSSGSAPLVLDAAGLPTPSGSAPVRAFAVIPRCATTATGALPVVIFGAGLFLNVQTMLESSAWQQVAQDVCAVYVGTNLIGLSGDDLGLAADAALNDVNKLYLITDRLQQAQMNLLALARVMRTRLADSPAFSIGAQLVFDPSRVHYFGISNGGIQAPAFLALTEDVDRGVLNVPGCEWSLLLSRSTDFVPFKSLLKDLLPDPIDQQLIFALSQTEWDHTDAATWAPLVTKRVLIQEAIGDAQVSNVSTRILARLLGLPALAGLVQPVFGITESAAPLDSAYTQWDAHAEPAPPLGNVALPMDNIAHNSIWISPKGKQQVKAFFASAPGGQVVDVCGGPCTDY